MISFTLKRTFEEWWSCLSEDMKYNLQSNHEEPDMNQVNFIWLTNIINRNSLDGVPFTLDILEWITSGKINAKRK